MMGQIGLHQRPESSALAFIRKEQGPDGFFYLWAGPRLGGGCLHREPSSRVSTLISLAVSNLAESPSFLLLHPVNADSIRTLIRANAKYFFDVFIF